MSAQKNVSCRSALAQGSVRMDSFLASCLILLIVAAIVARHGLSPSRNGFVSDATLVTGRISSRATRRRNGPDGSAQPEGGAASYARFSSDLQDENTIVTQRQACREAAEREGLSILSELEFCDEAVSGTKLRRAGLDALLAAADAGRIRVLFFFSLSRLARESVITMPLLKKLVYVNRVRVVSVSEGVDSDRNGWDLMAMILSLQHERYIKELSANVLRGQKGNIQAGFSNGDFCFGYKSEPVPGSEKGRRGRHARPRMIYVIDPETTKWVLQIFHWFVVERRPLRWIARELNRLGAPKDHRATTKHWRHQYLPKLLRRRKYIGIWPWGQMQNVRNPLTGKVTQEERAIEETEQWVRHFPHLQIIDQDTFDRAEQLLQLNEARHAHRHQADGKFSHDQHGAAADHPRHLLSGLVYCGKCGAMFNVGGGNGKYMFCPGHHQGVCNCQTTLRRERAERLILDEVSRRILDNPAWLQAIQDRARTAWHDLQRSLPNELATTESAMADMDRRIEKLLDSLEDGKADPDVKQRLAERRAARQELAAKLQRLRQTSETATPEPTKDWLMDQVRNLAATLAGSGPAAAFALRDLVGGRITVEEVRREGRQRHFLRGTFTIRIANAALALQLPVAEAVVPENEEGERISIDFVAPNPLDAKAEQAKVLWDEGLLGQEIARQMGCSKSQITKLLKHWSTLHGEALPDGRARRSQLNHQHVVPPQYQAVAEEVMCLVNAGRLLQDIAETLDCDRNTVTKAIKFWHESRGLAAPDGRTRRKELPNKVSRPRRRDEDQNGAAEVA